MLIGKPGSTKAFCLAVLWLGCVAKADSTQLLFRITGHNLKGSRFGKVAAFQRALSAAVVGCGGTPIEADGNLGSQTAAAIRRYRSCVHRESVPLIDVQLWASLLPDVSLPTVHERSFVLSLSHEGTDYDTIEWNYGTHDDAAALTWGPYGATVGYGNEVRAILTRIDHTDPKLLPSIFGSDYSDVQRLLEAPSQEGYAVLKSVYSDNSARERWKSSFRNLGERSEVRETYDWYAFDSGSWISPAMKRLYHLLPGEHGTEIDYAFFLDLAIHMSITLPRIQKTQQAIAASEKVHSLTPGERRRIISDTLVPNSQKSDRLGRNVVYFVDAIGVEKLTPNEKQAWSARTGRRASDCGLSDSRDYSPPF